MEFKGTKGKWTVLSNAKYSDVVKIKSDKGSPTFGENEANALLISKAPEMLDFINRISGEMLRNDFVLHERWYEQARQLIKEATEL